jgi:MinD-like ATPase involved in chromosome partitioning or flagellar assembly
MALREQSDSGLPVVLADPRDPASEAITQIARRLIAMTPVERPVLADEPELPIVAPKAVGMSLPMA